MKRIGIVTFHNVYNYGGVLQAYALCKALKDHDVECIDYRQKEVEKKYSHKLYHPGKSIKENIKHFGRHFILRKDRVKEAKFMDFIQKFLPISSEPVHNLSGARKTCNKYDVLISGSDQIWNPQFTGGKIDPIYFLNFGRMGVKKLSYASSAGAHKFNDEDRLQLADYLGQYNKVSVREDFLKEQLSHLHKEVEVVVDPTLLLTKEEWIKIESPVEGLPKEFVLLYTFDDNQVCIESAIEIAKKLNCAVVSISNQRVPDKRIQFNLPDVGPREFIWLFHHARFVLTNSFHGTSFSIIFQKSFYSIYKNNNPFRVLNLLKRLDLEKRMIREQDEIYRPDMFINYELHNNYLDELRRSSIGFLKQAI